MLLSTQTKVLAARFGDERAIRILADAGFDAFDYSMFSMNFDGGIAPEHPLNQPDYLNYARKLRRVADEAGIVCNQAHAPFSFRDWTDEEKFNTVIVPAVKRAIEAAGVLGARVIVVHPIHHDKNGTAEERFAWNMRYYGDLLKTAEQANVRIATENMWQIDDRRRYIVDDSCSTAAEFNRYIDTMAHPLFTGCLDLGHCGLTGSDPAEMIRAMGADRVGALHVHDNDYLHDSHTMPFLSKMDWDAITRALADIGYRGDFTFEADNFFKGMDDDFLPTAEKFLHDCGRYLIRKIEQAKA